MKHPGPTPNTLWIDYNGGMKSRWNSRIVELAHTALLEMRPDSDSDDLLIKVHSKYAWDLRRGVSIRTLTLPTLVERIQTMRQEHLHDEEFPSDDEEILQDQPNLRVIYLRRKSRWRAVSPTFRNSFLKPKFVLQTGNRRILTARIHPETFCFVALLERVVPSATSDDETDHGEGTWTGGFLVRLVEWRSMELLQLLMDLDDLATIDRYNPDTASRGRGNLVRHRLRIAGLPQTESVLNQSEPPFDLPMNCYSVAWVQTLCEDDRARLIADAQPAIDLSIDPTLKK